MSEKSVTLYAEKVPGTIEELETARQQVLKDPADFHAYSDAFYKSFSSEEPGGGLEEAVGRYLMGQPARVLEALQGVEGDLPAYIRSRISLEGGNSASALKEIESLAAKDEPAVRRLRMEALAQLGSSEELETLVRELEKSEPEAPDLSYFQGLLCEVGGDYAEASRLYQQTLAVAPDHTGSLFRLAYHESLRGETESAIEIYERLTQLKPAHTGALMNLGLLFEDEEDYQLAAECFRRILEFDPTNQRARMYLVDATSSLSMFYDEEKERKEDKRAQVMRIPVTDFELSVRARNCLANMNVRTLGDLIKLSEAELLAFKNFGETSLHEIKQILVQKGLRLGMQAAEDAPEPESAAPADPDSLLARSVIELDLSVRSRKALESLGLNTIGDLIQVPEGRLLACKNFGQTSLMEIKKKLGDMGLSMGG